ncbi:MAG: biotin/lipoyl-containing protein [Rikenellaceae bacterium]
MEEKKYDIVSTRHGDFQTTFNKKHLLRKKWQPVNPKELKSFIPGTVVEICVKEGQSVKESDILMIYKAMKMNNNIRADKDGVIKKIYVKEGDNLPNRALMLEFE